MLNHIKPDITEKKQLIIFLSITFVLPYLMGILMGYTYNKGFDVSGFPNAQMYYPAAGIMLAILLTKKEDKLIPRKFFICFITITCMMLLFLLLYFRRVFLSYSVGGQLKEFVKLLKDPMFYRMTLLLSINFFFVFTAFFGEEYGWRYYFTPFLQKHFGKVNGVLLQGVLWGLWHLPINIFYLFWQGNTGIRKRQRMNVEAISDNLLEGCTTNRVKHTDTP